MTTRYVQAGKVLDFTNAGAAIASGAGVLVGTRLGVALTAIPAGATGSVQICGVFSMPKLGTDNMTQGALVYWDSANARLTTTASGNTLAGVAAAAAGAGVASVSVLLNGVPA
jgi:predicted RecA/RadA family phage recombinase